MLKFSKIKKLIDNNQPFVLHESFSENSNYSSKLFIDIEKIIEPSAKTASFFCDIAKNSGKWIVGFVNYEFAVEISKNRGDLAGKAWFAVCSDVEKYNDVVIDCISNFPDIINIVVGKKKSEYIKDLLKIKEYLENGDTYQVNYTIPIHYELKNSVLDLYLYLRKSQPTKYMYLINTGSKYIISCSPELFFEKKNNRILMSPMKGTIARGKSLEKDLANKDFLLGDEKNRAENLMIVDMVRNDLSNAGEKTKVLDLFRIESFFTVHQMVSDICTVVPVNITLGALLANLFPCASITGAPKINTMEIIKKLEKRERGIYTGCIGYVSPNNDMNFNVAIRTTEIINGLGQLGVGGGIVWDSVIEDEHQEALLKAKFFTNLNKGFDLIETMLVEQKRAVFLDEHYKRMMNSSNYFHFKFNKELFDGKIKDVLVDADLDKKYILRMTLTVSGIIDCTLKEIEDTSIDTVWKIKIKDMAVNSDNVFLYHKTSRRELYNLDREQALAEGYDEIIYHNKQGLITEGAISNVYIKKNGQLLTPAVSCGLLAGIYRDYMLESKQAVVAEIICSDLEDADEIYLSNSVRGLVKASL